MIIADDTVNGGGAKALWIKYNDNWKDNWWRVIPGKAHGIPGKTNPGIPAVAGVFPAF